MQSIFNHLRSAITTRARVNQGGYTMVEIIVMTAILSIGLLSTAAVSNVTLRTSDRNERVATATNLAREGIELVRAIRDTNWQAYSYQLNRQAQDNTTPTRGLADWDCFINSLATSAEPNGYYGCAGHLAQQNAQNFIIYPATEGSNYFGRGVPVLVGPASGVPDQTSNPQYLLCAQPSDSSVSGSPLVFRPLPGSAVCPGTTEAFYRRIRIDQGKTDPADPSKYVSFHVTTYVNWPGRTAADIVAEEYITDWKRFNTDGIPSASGPAEAIPAIAGSSGTCAPAALCFTTPAPESVLYTCCAPVDMRFSGNGLQAGQTYKLIISYRNVAGGGGLNAAPNYAYNIRLSVGGVQVPAPALPINPGAPGNTLRDSEIIPFTPTSNNPTLTITWINDFWTAATYDANFGIKSLRVLQ